MDDQVAPSNSTRNRSLHPDMQSHDLMSLPVNPATAEANIAIPFHQSCGKSSAEGDPLFAMLGIKFPQQAAATAAPSSMSAAAPALAPKG